MEAFLPDENLRTRWIKQAQEESRGPRADFWRSLPDLPERPEAAHKGTFGTALAVGGSRGMSGAIALTGSACLFAGAGLTRLAVPNAVLDTVAQFQREYTTIPLNDDPSGKIADNNHELDEQRRKATVMAIGPGLGRSAELDKLVARQFVDSPIPTLFDADALNALAETRFGTPEGKTALSTPLGARVLTPHPGEFARLSGRKPSVERAERIEAARAFLEIVRENVGGLQADFVVALKGHETIVALASPVTAEIKIAVNRTGNANLASGGSGDVLSGMILGLMAQGKSAFDAARLGVALHGLAAELRATICSRGGIASDAARFLPVAFDYFLAVRRFLATEEK